MIEHDSFDRVRRVGNTFINYDNRDRVSRIGTVYMKYDRFGLTQIGGMKISYNNRGQIVSTYGNINGTKIKVFHTLIMEVQAIITIIMLQIIIKQTTTITITEPTERKQLLTTEDKIGLVFI